MAKKIITFGDIATEKQKLQQHKNRISIYDVDINKRVVSSKLRFGKKKVLNNLLATKLLKKLDRYSNWIQNKCI